MFERLKRLFRNGSENIKKKENIVIKTPYKKFMKEVIPRSNIKKKGKISKNVIEINKFKKADPNVLKLRKTVIGFQLDFNKIDLKLFFKKKGNIFATSVFVLILIVIISFSFGTRADLAKVDLYPKNCLGGWNNPNLAEGEPDTKNVDEYSKNNSAFLSNPNAEIFCAGFEGDLPDETNIPIKFSLKLAMLVANSELPENDDEGSIPSIDSGPIEIVPEAPPQPLPEEEGQNSIPETTPLPPPSNPVGDSTESGGGEIQPPAETAAPIETPVTPEAPNNNEVINPEPQALLNKITPLAYAQETEITFDEVTPQTNEHALLEESGQITENDFLDVVYSIDGTEWKTLGKINGKNWQDASFDFEDENIKTFADIAKIQVSLKPIASIDAQPVIYLDSMYIEVLYENMKIETPGNLPKVSIDEQKADLNIISGSQEFSLNDTPVFTISDPDLTTYEIAKLVVDGKATVIEDTDKVIEDTVLVDTNILQEVKSPDIIEPVVENLPELEINNSNIIDNVLNIFEGNETVVEPTSETPPQPLPEGEGQNSETPQTETPTQETITNSTTETAPPPASEETTPQPPPSQGEGEIQSSPTDQGIISSLFFQKVFAQSGPQIVSATVVNVAGDMTDIHTNIGTTVVDGVEKSQVTIDKPERQFKPGKYTLKIILQTDNALLEVHQDFTWGVLVVNTNKSIYDAGDDAYIQMGVLDDGGHTICAAKLEMDIKTPSGALTHYSTDEGSTNLIVQDAQCGPDNFVEDGTPDYHTHFTNTTLGGQYDIKLTATTENGVKVINDKFFVDSATAFDVERITASRIQPVNVYPVTLKVKSKNAFVGTIVERVPADFEITEPQNSLVYDDVEIVGETKIITWNLDFEAGETKTLGYYYDAPNISPEIFLLGSLQAIYDNNEVWKESRQWQIASDAVCIAAGTGNWTSITWTNCGGGPTAADSVQIPNGFTVTLDTSPTVDSIDIQNGGTLTNDGNARTLTLDGTTGTLFTLGGTGTFTPSTYISVVMNPDAAITTTSGAITFYNLTFSPTITAGRTWTMGGGALTINGDFDINPSAASSLLLLVNMGASITVDSGKTMYIRKSSSARSRVDTISGSNYGLTAGNLVIDGNQSGTLVQNGAALTLNGTSGTLVTVISGTITQGVGATTNFQSNADVTLSSGTWNLTRLCNINPTITANRIYSLGSMSFANNVTINPTASSSYSLTVNLTQNLSHTVNTITVQASSSATAILDTTASNYSVTSSRLSIAAGGTFKANASTVTITTSTNSPLNIDGTFNAGTSTFLLNGPTSGTSAVITGSTSPTFYNLTVSPTITASTSIAFQFVTGTAVAVSNNFNISPTAASAYTWTMALRGNLTVAGTTTLSVSGSVTSNTLDTIYSGTSRSFSTGKLNIGSGCVLLANASTVTFTGTGTAGSRPFINSGTFTPSTSTVVYTGAGNVEVTSETYNNLSLQPTSGTETYYLGTASSQTITAVNLTINNGATLTVDWDTYDPTLNISGNVTLNSGTTWTKSASATLTLKPTGTKTWTDSTSGIQDMGIVVIGSGASTPRINLASSVKVTTLTVNASHIFDFNGSNTLTLTGTGGTPLSNSGTFTVSTGTVAFTGNNAGGNTTIPSAITYYSVTVNNSAETYVLNGTTTLNAAGILTVTDGTLDTTGSNYAISTGKISIANSATAILLGNASTITLTGTSGTLFTRGSSGVFTQGTSTVDVAGNGDATFNSGTLTFYDLTFTGTGVKSLGGNITINNNMTVSAGTFNPTASYTVTGSGTNSLIVNAGTIRSMHSTFAGDYISFETVTLNTNSTVDYYLGGTQTVEQTLSYYNLAISTSGTKSPNGATTATGTITVNGGTLDTNSCTSCALNAAQITIQGGELRPRNSNVTISGTDGHPFTYTSGTFTYGTSKIIFTGNNGAGNTAIEDAVTYYDVTVNNASETYVMEGTTTLTRTLTITLGTFDTTGSNYTLNIGKIDIASSASAIFTANDSTVTLSATSGTLFTKGISGTFNYGTSDVHLQGNGATITATNNQAITFYDLYIDPTITAGSAYTFGTSVLTVDNNFTINPTAASSLALTVNMGAAISVTGTMTLSKTSSATSVLDTRPASTNYNITTSILTINSGATLDCTSSASVILINSGSQTTFTNNGTFNYGLSNVYYMGNYGSGNKYIEDTDYYNLFINDATETYELTNNTVAYGAVVVEYGTLTTTGSNYSLTAGGLGVAIAGTVPATLTLNASNVFLTSDLGFFADPTYATINAGTSTIKFTDSTSSPKIFSGGGKTYNNLWFAPGAGTGDFEIRGSNTFADFKDDGTSAHTILFTESTTTTVTTFTVSGNSGQLIIINSGDGAGSPSTNTHSLVKSGGGVISSDYLDIQHSVATPTLTWYAGANSTNNQGVANAGSGWYFTVPPCQSTATGNWNDGSKWVGCAGVGGIPATTDDVIVNSGHTITLNTAPTVLTVDIFGTLDTSGTNYAFNSGKLTIESGGTLTANGSTITLSGTDGSPFVNSGGTFTAGTSTFIFTGNNTGGNTTIPAQAFYNLTINNSSETFVLAGNTTMNALGTVTVTLGTLSTTGSNFSLSAGKVVIADSTSAIFTANASTITLSATSGTIFDKGSNGVFNYGTSTVVMNGNGNVRLTQDNILGVGALDFYNLSLTPTVETSNKTYTFGTITTTIHGDLNIIPDSTSGKTLTFNCDFDSGYFLGYVNVDPAKTITLDVAGSANLAYDNNSGAYVGTFSMGHIVFGSSNITVPNFTGYLTGTTGTLITKAGTGVDLTTVLLDVYLDSSTVTFSDESLSLVGTNITANTASTLTLGGNLTTSTYFSLSCAGGNLDFDTAGYDLTLPVLTISGVNGNLVNFIANDSIVNIGSGGLSVDALDIFALSVGTSNFIISGPLLIYGDILFYDLNLVPDLVGGDITWATYSYPVYNAINSNTYVLATYNDFNINPENSGGSTPYVFDITTENVFGSVGDFSIGSQDAFSSAVIHVGPDDLGGGSITIGSAGEIDGGSNDITVGTNWTNNGTFTQGTSTVYFSSASNSVISGDTTFYNLTIENTDDGLAKQMDFSTTGSAIYQVDNTFTVTGNPSQLIKLWSSSSPTQWNFKPLGTASVNYADVMDGGCEVGSINIYPLTSYNSGNNDSCWVFAPTLTFSIDDPSIGFGPLSSSSARFATADTSGSNTDTTYATRMNISTTNSYGFSLTYLGDLLKSGSDDINAGNITNDADGTQGTEEFGISVAVSGGSTVTSGYDHNATPANRDWKYVANTTSQIVSDTVDVTNENIDVYYLTNTSTVTPAGSYSTTITYIVTGTF